jgi:hypothetical protein
MKRCLLVIAAASSLALAANANGQEKSDELTRRRERLFALASRADEVLALRALQELVVLGKSDPKLGQQLILIIRARFSDADRAFNNVFSPAAYVSELAELGPPVVPQILEAVEAEEISESAAVVLVATLAHMGPKAKEATPRLRRKLADHRTSAFLKRCCRLALANLGDEPAQKLVIKELEESYMGGDTEGGDPEKWATLLRWTWVVCWVRVGDWGADVIVKRLGRQIASYAESRPTGDPLYLLPASEVPKYADKAQKLSDQLEAAQRHALRHDRAEAIGFTLALARVDVKKRDAALERLCADWPDNQNFFGWFIFLEFVPRLVDTKITAELVRLLERDDPKIAERAGSLLTFAGLSARETVPQLVALMKRSKDRRRREIVVEVLGSVVDITRIDQLEQLRKHETDADVRTKLDDAIHRIRWLE